MKRALREQSLRYWVVAAHEVRPDAWSITLKSIQDPNGLTELIMSGTGTLAPLSVFPLGMGLELTDGVPGSEFFEMASEEAS